MVFTRGKKNDTSNQNPETRVRFFQVFSWKLNCNSFVSFTVHKENCREPAKQQQKEKNKMRWKLKLDFLMELFTLLGN